jgi:hypothetical protein
MTPGAPVPHAHSTPIELSLHTLAQLFNSLDPSPFRDRDLDPQAAQYIIEEAEDRPHEGLLSVLIHVPASDFTAASVVSSAMQRYFTLCRHSEERKLRRIFREGRFALLVGLIAVVLIVALVNLLSGLVPEGSPLRGVVESLVILAWVVLWRPAELLLYDWWPVRKRINLFRRLEAAHVQVKPAERKPDGKPTDINPTDVNP